MGIREPLLICGALKLLSNARLLRTCKSFAIILRHLSILCLCGNCYDVNNRIVFCWSLHGSGILRSKLAILEMFLESFVVVFVSVVAGVLA